MAAKYPDSTQFASVPWWWLSLTLVFPPQVASILGKEDPDRFFMGKKSKRSASDGRRTRPKPAEHGESQGCSASGEEGECGATSGGESAPAQDNQVETPTTSPPSRPRLKSKIIIGPGGAKWEIFQNVRFKCVECASALHLRTMLLAA